MSHVFECQEGLVVLSHNLNRLELMGRVNYLQADRLIASDAVAFMFAGQGETIQEARRSIESILRGYFEPIFRAREIAGVMVKKFTGKHWDILQMDPVGVEQKIDAFRERIKAKKPEVESLVLSEALNLTFTRP